MDKPKDILCHRCGKLLEGWWHETLTTCEHCHATVLAIDRHDRSADPSPDVLRLVSELKRCKHDWYERRKVLIIQLSQRHGGGFIEPKAGNEDQGYAMLIVIGVLFLLSAIWIPLFGVLGIIMILAANPLRKYGLKRRLLYEEKLAEHEIQRKQLEEQLYEAIRKCW